MLPSPRTGPSRSAPISAPAAAARCSISGPASYAAFKTEAVERALRDAHVASRVAPLIDAHGDGRRRATLHARGKAVGYMQARSHDLLDIDRCPILVPALQSARRALGRADRGDDRRLRRRLHRERHRARRRDHAPSERLKPERLTLLAQRSKLARLSLNGETVLEARAPAVRMGKAMVELPIGSFLQATAMAEQALARLVRRGRRARRNRSPTSSAALGPFALRLAEQAQGLSRPTATSAGDRGAAARRCA